MDIYEKMNEIKLHLLEADLKKSGKNKFCDFKYFELVDFIPTILKKCKEHKLYSHTTFEENKGTMTIINLENKEEQLEFVTDLKEITVKGGNAMQSYGAIQTYARRYLNIMAFDILEQDLLDATSGAENKDTENKDTKYISKEYKSDYVFDFGKCKGKAIKDMFANPEDLDYLKWLYSAPKTDEGLKNLICTMGNELKNNHD